MLRVLGQPVEQQRRRTYQVLKWVGLQHRHQRLPARAVGRRAAARGDCARARQRAALVLADEPTGNLDPDLSLEIMNLFRDINASGTTVLVATHDRELIKWVGRRVIQLEHGRQPGSRGAGAVTVVGYAFEEALASLRRSGRSALVSIGTIAIAFLTLGGFLLVSVNVQGMLDRWLEAAEMSVYLHDTATDAERQALEQMLRARPEVAAVEYVSKERALERFRADFPELRRRDRRRSRRTRFRRRWRCGCAPRRTPMRPPKPWPAKCQDVQAWPTCGSTGGGWRGCSAWSAALASPAP